MAVKTYVCHLEMPRLPKITSALNRFDKCEFSNSMTSEVCPNATIQLPTTSTLPAVDWPWQMEKETFK